MPEFLELIPPNEALETLLRGFKPDVEGDEVETVLALGRVSLGPVFAPHPLPTFARSTMDGYAVRAIDTFGASEALPVYSKVVGEVLMGSGPTFHLAASECAIIHTGGMLPGAADAVVMVEHTQQVIANEVEIYRSVAVGENVLKVGEDVIAGQEVISSGTRLRPAEIGGLMALGITRLKVARQPWAGILSSGDEVVPPAADLLPGQVRDVNGYTLSALVQEAGGFPVFYGIIPDQMERLRETAQLAVEECDLVIITAGSSASARDLTAQVIHQLGTPGVLVHGVNVRPGKPTILAVCQNKPVIGLPGNPVSALVIASLFVKPVVEALLGLKRDRPQAIVQAKLSVNLPSQAGREDWVAVVLVKVKEGYRADPVFGKSNLIFTLARADGMVKIPAEATGLGAGEVVEVFLI